MKVFKKIIEYSFYVFIILVFTFLLSLFNGSGRKLQLNHSDYLLLTDKQISKEFPNKNKVIYFWATWCSVCQTIGGILSLFQLKKAVELQIMSKNIWTKMKLPFQHFLEIKIYSNQIKSTPSLLLYL